MLGRIRRRFADAMISGTHQGVLWLGLWLVSFIAVLVVLSAIAAVEVRKMMYDEAAANIANLERVRANVAAAFRMLEADVSAEPCTPPFHRQLRRVAFEPDGLNEFLYAPNGVVLCSTSKERFAEPVPLGTPDLTGATKLGDALWIDKQLDSVGLAGVRATIVRGGQFAIVIPAERISESPSSRWLSEELVISMPEGRTWHRDGKRGVFARAVLAETSPIIGLFDFSDIVCDSEGFHCVASETTVPSILKGWPVALTVALLFAATLAAWLASAARRALLRRWSLEERFCRHMTAGTVLCTYQPLLDLRSGAIAGCEVLARWRDVNGDIVSPDAFIDIVERNGLTRTFTKMVVDTAFRELSRNVPPDVHLQVNFNIFPEDFDSATLIGLFSPFFAAADRFEVVVELVESDYLPLDRAQREVELLNHAGIKTYIDDFGTGFSNIHNLASLAVAGVKIDRSFAMAPDDSMMAKMLVHALDMVITAGRKIVVEGIETRDRLELLRATGKVDYIQGYLVSRPLRIEDFVRFLAAHRAVFWLESRAA